MRSVRGLFGSLLVLTILAVGVSPGAAAPEGQMDLGGARLTGAYLVRPRETSGIITPFMVLMPCTTPC